MTNENNPKRKDKSKLVYIVAGIVLAGIITATAIRGCNNSADSHTKFRRATDKMGYIQPNQPYQISDYKNSEENYFC